MGPGSTPPDLLGQLRTGHLPSLEYIHWHAFDPVSAIGSTLLATFIVIVLSALAYQRLEL